ncbi:MAG: hypothetical protein WBP79_14075, partial [Candidatus Acidiferrales bacterium]
MTDPLPTLPGNPSASEKLPATGFLVACLAVEVVLIAVVFFGDPSFSGPRVFPCFLFVAPFTFALVTILWVGRGRWVARAGGVAFIAGLLLDLAIIPLLGLEHMFSGITPAPPAAVDISLKILIPLSLATSVAGVRARKPFGETFAAAALITFFYAILIPGFLSSSTMLQRQHQVENYTARDNAAYALRVLTSCLIDYKFQHPGTPFPDSLAAVSRLPGCDAHLARPRSLSGYVLWYKRRKDSASGQITNYQLIARPSPWFKHPMVDPMFTDNSGRIYTLYGWSMKNVEAQIHVMPSDLYDSHCDNVYNGIMHYPDRSEGHKLPASFDDMYVPAFASLYILPQGKIEGAAHTELQLQKYRLVYSPQDEAHPDKFSLAATCTNYGVTCVRSYLWDEDGQLHATPEKRRAMQSDPV